MTGLRLESAPDGSVLLKIKAVPGSSRDQIAGLLGDRLKVRVSAPPEAGKANQAVCELIAKSLGIKPASVTIHSGHASQEKTVRVSGLSIERLTSLLTELLG